jgi:hypothetical protein
MATSIINRTAFNSVITAGTALRAATRTAPKIHVAPKWSSGTLISGSGRQVNRTVNVGRCFPFQSHGHMGTVDRRWFQTVYATMIANGYALLAST